MVGVQDKKTGVPNLDKPDSVLAEELNRFYLRFNWFYLRFNSHDFSNELAKFRISSVGRQINFI